MHIFDVFIIGGGQAGIPLAHALAQSGKRVALAERKHLGGSCVNFGCTPTKAAIASARVAHLARRARDFGLHIRAVEVDFPAVLARARAISAQSRTRLRQSMSGENPKLFETSARLDGRHNDLFHVRVGSELVGAQQVVLNTGTRSALPPIEGLESVPFLHSGNWLHQHELPQHLVMIGGGYIGLEMGQFYRRMGSRVTVVQRGRQIAPKEDHDVASALQELLEREGVEFHLENSVRRVSADSGGVTVTLDRGQLRASHLFVAVGRKPNIDDLGLETVGIEIGEKIPADERLSTGIPGLWAAGDIRGGPMFTHTSWDDYRILLSQINGDGSRTTRRVVPYAIFTDPELGRVGLTEAEARNQGYSVKIGKFEMKANGKAKELGEPDGFVKVVVDGANDRILGAAVLAVEGAELVHVFVDLMNANATWQVLRDAVHIHPTLAEAVQSAAAAVA